MSRKRPPEELAKDNGSTLNDFNFGSLSPARPTRPRHQELQPPSTPVPADGSSISALSSSTKPKKKKSDNIRIPLLSPKKRKTTQVQSSILQSFSKPPEEKNIFLQQEYPDPVQIGTEKQPAEHRVTEIQFQRDTLSSLPSVEDTPPQHIQQLPLNEEQQRVVLCQPNVPLSIRAGAGSGKTHCMVQRTINLIIEWGINPENILIITFSNKATDELKERIIPLLVNQRGENTKLPTIRTFHSLAFSWICKCWKSCGLKQFPSPLGTQSQERDLIRCAIKENLNRLMLNECREMLWQGMDTEEEDMTWEMVLDKFKQEYATEYDKLYSEAVEKAEEFRPTEPKKKKKTDKWLTAEEQQTLQKDIKEVRKAHLRLGCYHSLLKLKKRRKRDKTDDEQREQDETLGQEDEKLKGLSDLEKHWLGDRKQCNEFLKMIRNARLGHHSKEEYLPEHAAVWEIYEDLQYKTGRIDFDNMLVMFTQHVLGNEKLAERFHSMYTHVIVDEYQDNSEDQARMLNKIVRNGCLTVVGDDDQCIYEFRGASPGNFGRLNTFFLNEHNITLQEETLVENHRSTENILQVAAKFLENDTLRLPKTLNPTRPAGMPVEVWHCETDASQARHIVSAMIKRHEQDGISYGDMACLYRCFKMGNVGQLNICLQKELAAKNVPFIVVGGTTIFERAAVLDILAYLRLSIKGSHDDEAFKRVLNKPKRRLPADKLIPLIEELTNPSRGEKRATSLQEAAERMCETGFSLTTSRHKALKGFLAVISSLQRKAIEMSLPDIIKYIWHIILCGDDDEDDDSSDGGDEDSEEEDIRLDMSTRTNSDRPLEVDLLIGLAERHVNEWGKKEKVIIEQSRCNGVKSLVEQTRKKIMKKLNSKKSETREEWFQAINELPDHILDDIILAPEARGRAVVKDFLACSALQNSTENEEPSIDKKEKVSISTIHRAKGLEWSDVYVPYFNDSYLPTHAQKVDVDRGIGERHLPDCTDRDKEYCSCIRRFQEIEAERLGASHKERHLNEERRLAHVAATRAKDKLVFTTFREYVRKDLENPKQSEFIDGLRQLPNEVCIERRY